MVKIISPVDGSIVAERPYATQAAIDAALVGTRAAHNGRGAARPWPNALAFARQPSTPCSRWPMRSCPSWRGKWDVPSATDAANWPVLKRGARHMIEIAGAALADHVPSRLDGFRRLIRREPLGTVFVIAPWNYPFLTAVNSVIPALMAGNAVVLKHSAQTLLVGERLQAAFDKAGLPSGLFRNFVLDHHQTAQIIRSGYVQQVNFTGSVGAGREIERAGAGLFIGIGLELGGKDPAYVRADANLEFAIENIADGAFFNSGQSCCAVERVYVDRRHFDRVVGGLAAAACKYVLGNPLDPQTTLGPMVRGAAADVVRNQVSEALSLGARRVVPAHAFPPDRPGSAYLAPEVLVNVHHDMALMREETFGPVVGVMPVDSDDEAIERMNDSPFGLSASIWTQDADAAERIGEQLETGTVFMNRCDYLDPALAWTGVKNTGRGITLSVLGYSALTRASRITCARPLAIELLPRRWPSGPRTLRRSLVSSAPRGRDPIA